MLAVAKCCLMAIPRSDSSPASPLPGFFLRDKPHYSSDCTSHSLFFGWPCGETSRSGGYRRSGSRATILYDLRRIHSTSPVPVPRNKISQTSSKGAPRRYVIRATIHAPPTSQIMIARGTGTGSTPGRASPALKPSYWYGYRVHQSGLFPVPRQIEPGGYRLLPRATVRPDRNPEGADRPFLGVSLFVTERSQPVAAGPVLHNLF
jgi:hypothetical protein